jgi:hypothetical protein
MLAVAQPFAVDTIGGTTYDWGANGPSLRMLHFDPTLGVHAIWQFSASDQSSFPDRNIRYNFYDAGTSSWAFNQGSNFMDYGVNAFSVRSGYGALAVNPTTGCAYIGAHQGNIFPIMARDAAPGSGTFEDCTGEGGPADQYLWPCVAVDRNEKVHVGVVDNASRNAVYYTRVDPWCTWAAPVHIGDVDPNFDDHYLEASLTSNKIAITWTNVDATPYQMYYQMSNDGGNSWDPMVTLEFPPAYTPGSDTQASFHLSGGAFLWDASDNMHLVANIMPVVGGTGYIIPTEIWHYCPANSPAWTKVARAGCDTLNLMGSSGYNSLYMSRPILSIDGTGKLYCIWEQMDSMNVETSTGLMRADIFGAKSEDNGMTWGDPLKITVSDATTHRYPSVARDVGNTVHVSYINDLIAGQFVQSLGPATNNPFCHVGVPIAAFPGGAVGEGRSTRPAVSRLTVSPNPFGATATIRYELNRPGAAALRIYDASGNLVKTLASGAMAAGTRFATWNGTNDLNKRVAGGIYFARFETGDRVLSQKVVFSR